MLFAKTESQTAPITLNLAILGTSPLSFYLAAELQKSGHRITVVCRPAEADEFNATDFVFKDSRRLQSRRHNFRFAFELETPPQLLLITSDMPRLRSDLLLLAPSRLSDAPIVSFTPETPSGLISDILNRPVINALFDGWLTREKNHIICFSRRNGVTFGLNETSPQFSFMQDVFTGSGIEVRADENSPRSFWNWFAPRIIAALVIAASGRGLDDLAKSPDGRKLIDAGISEVIILAANDGVRLENTEILSQIYNTPESDALWLQTAKPAQNTLLLERLTALLFHGIAADDQRFPILRGLLKKIRNNL